ncbi:MAG: FkbM family methyltransferase [Caulobacteraceae bacterium]|nr:FkbM family methyltransferase [Caulobacteraceae bacterium]
MEESFLEPLQKSLVRGPCRVAVDIGANDGEWTLWLAERFDHVLALEPDPRAAKKLRGALPANATLIEAACCPEAGVADFYLRENPDQSSILPEHPIGCADQREAPVQSKSTVNAMTMDGILDAARSLFGCDEIDFVKLDIEGAEHLAMNSATPSLFRNTRWLVEVHDNRVEVGAAVRRLGHEDLQIVNHPHPGAHPNHLWILVNESR